jgi:hypothetical protein
MPLRRHNPRQTKLRKAWCEALIRQGSGRRRRDACHDHQLSGATGHSRGSPAWHSSNAI